MTRSRRRQPAVSLHSLLSTDDYDPRVLSQRQRSEAVTVGKAQPLRQDVANEDRKICFCGASPLPTCKHSLPTSDRLIPGLQILFESGSN